MIEKFNKMDKKKLRKNSLTVLAVLVAALIVGRTVAFFTDSASKRNTFVMGDVKISLTEPNWDDAEDGKAMVPGYTTLKDPVVKATKNDSYMRMIIEIQDKDGNLITDTKRLDLIKKTIYYDISYDNTKTIVTANLVAGSPYALSDLTTLASSNVISNLYNNNSFTFDNTRSTDNKLIYNYNTVFTEGTEAVLFSNIVIPSDYTKDNLDLMGEYKINVYAEGIQTKGFDNSTDAYSALDKK